jgi:hypothetical protein
LNRVGPGQTGRGREAADVAAWKGEEVVRMDDDHDGMPVLTRPGK